MKTFVEKEWNDLHFHVRGVFILKEKLKALKAGLKTWNAKVFGDLTTKENELSRKLEWIDRKAYEKVVVGGRNKGNESYSI